MTNSYWKTGSGTAKRRSIQWPSLGQLVRQVALAAIVSLLWAGLLFGYIRLTGAGNPTETLPADAAGQAVAVEVTATATLTSTPLPTVTSTPPPTNTSTATSTPPPTATPTSTTTPSPTGQPALAETAALAATSVAPDPSPTATFTPSPIPTDTPPPLPTATPGPPPTATPPTATPVPLPTATPAGSTAVSYSNDVFPILERRCIKCHGGTKADGTLRIEEGLDMRSYAGLLAGSFNGPVIEPGNAAESYLVELITAGEMPKNEPRLLPAEIRTISAWIDAGAPEN